MVSIITGRLLISVHMVRIWGEIMKEKLIVITFVIVVFLILWGLVSAALSHDADKFDKCKLPNAKYPCSDINLDHTTDKSVVGNDKVHIHVIYSNNPCDGDVTSRVWPDTSIETLLEEDRETYNGGCVKWWESWTAEEMGEELEKVIDFNERAEEKSKADLLNTVHVDVPVSPNVEDYGKDYLDVHTRWVIDCRANWKTVGEKGICELSYGNDHYSPVCCQFMKGLEAKAASAPKAVRKGNLTLTWASLKKGR